MKRVVFLILAITLCKFVFPQADSPYRTNFTDVPVIAGGIGLSFLGLNMIKNKEPLTQAEVLSRSKSDVNFFDRFAAGNYSNSIDDTSYYPFYASFAMPVTFLLNDNIGKKTGQVLVLYVETMAITSTLFTLTAGTIARSRPLVYSSKAPMAERMDKDSQRSFYAGHTAASAAATFFAAKVFTDFNPESSAKPYVWATAAVIPAVVGYMRTASGRHFLSDNIVGYAVGAATGVIVPNLHKKSSDQGLTIVPLRYPGYEGLVLKYTF